MAQIVLSVFALLVGFLALVGAVVFVFVSRKAREASVRVTFPYVVFDVETTGLDSLLNGVVEIAARDSNGREFQAFVSPWDGCAYDEYALKVNGMTMAEILMGISELGAVQALEAWLKDAPRGWFFVGANPSFDHAFISALIARVGSTVRLDYHKMDIQSMALCAHAQGRITLPLNPKNEQPLVKVDALCEAFSISRSSEVHGALEDVRLEETILLGLLAL